ncbi:MAG: hypothetical protein BECKG1743D_GA0114223_101804 [Candidatus Kentron sp. G]|nr:MAG: hypothetical protein BECKG1743F_GA0114225_101703 [Candidatus Kentron sp. G]VFM98001.1 MAG: hypothetical protein BECKG1743E_GA0114224_101624 [Candidatus Kentron sp. G]VFN00273.1 MAG: hypothetical protein BECKG1743D_GA0114223_101804 [Candidatus Kentron sp. G]
MNEGNGDKRNKLSKTDVSREDSGTQKPNESAAEQSKVSQRSEVLERMPPEARKVVEFAMSMHKVPNAEPIDRKVE